MSFERRMRNAMAMSANDVRFERLARPVIALSVDDEGDWIVELQNAPRYHLSVHGGTLALAVSRLGDILREVEDF